MDRTSGRRAGPHPDIIAFRPAAGGQAPAWDDEAWRRLIADRAENLVAGLFALDPAKATALEVEALVLSLSVLRRVDMVETIAEVGRKRLAPDDMPCPALAGP